MKHLTRKFLLCLMALTAGTLFTASNTNSEKQEWILLADDVTTTVYNACARQCNADYLHTASKYTIDPQRIQDIRVLAMERTMMKEYGISYGTVVMIIGTGIYDGLWSVEDTMNIRFAGQHKIDLLVPSNIKHGKWNNVRIFIPANEPARKYCKNNVLI